MHWAELKSERVLFGVLFIVGYLALGALGAFILDKDAPALSLIRDMLLTLGPLLGVIVNAIWKTPLAPTTPTAATVVTAPDGSVTTTSQLGAAGETKS